MGKWQDALLWPDVFTDESLQYADMPEGKTAALCDALLGWGNCSAGATVPEGFGRGMVKIGEFLGITPTPENIRAIADRRILEQKARQGISRVNWPEILEPHIPART